MLIQSCTHILDNGVVRAITDSDKESIHATNTLWASDAMRVL